jgi:WD40 repeat protein
LICLVATQASAQEQRPRLAARLGHSAPQCTVAFSPDGKRVLTGGFDSITRLWDVETGLVIRRFEGRTESWSSVAFSPDGGLVLRGEGDGTTRLWNAETGRVVRTFRGHEGRVYSVAFFPDGRRVLTGGKDATARLWDIGSGREIRRLEHSGVIFSVAASPDGRWILTAGEDRKARLWNAETGREARRLEGHRESIGVAVFSPDGRLVLTGSDDRTARLWDVESGREVRRFEGHTTRIRFAAFAPGGRRVLTGTWGAKDHTARLWDAATGREIRRFAGATFTPVAFSPDGRMVLTGNCWIDRPSTPAEVGRAPLPSSTRLWDAETGREIRRFEGKTAWVSSVAFSPDGRQIVVGRADRVARLWSVEAGQVIRSYKGHAAAIHSVAFSPDGRRVLTAGADRTARLWNADTGRELRRFEGHEDEVGAAVFSPDGGLVLTGSRDGTARLWSAGTGQEVRRLEGHVNGVVSVAFSPDGRRLLTGSFGGAAQLWDPESGKRIRRFDGPEQWVRVAFSPDGRRVLTCRVDTARLWDAETGAEIRQLEGHQRWGAGAAFSPDGRRVLAGSGVKIARLWDVATGKEIGRFEHEGAVESVAFSPDGRWLLMGSADSTTRIWDARTLKERCRLIGFIDGTWAVVDPAGRYDASHGGDIDGLHWVVANDLVSLDQLKERYYEPGLLAKTMGHNPEPLRDVEEFTAPKLYPAVKLSREDGKLRIRLRNRGGGIGRVVVKVNGKERTADARGPKPEPDAKTFTVEEDLSDDPRLLPGEENAVEVFAYNAEGYLRSRGFKARFKVEGTKRTPHLWAVVAGVSDYRGDALDLRFAAKDAEDFANALKLAGTRFLGAERTHVTHLPNARRAELLDALSAIEANSSDILVLYLAGHGVTHGDRFYYLTADAQTADLTDTALRDTTAISSAQLTAAINASPALKQVLILDTCASGKLVRDLGLKRAIPSSQVRALERVKDRTGMFVLAGCAADKVSYEATRFGQGLLTYSLLLGMKAGKLREEQYVDVSTLFNFAADRVPQLARDIGGIQRPIVAQPRGGGSFDIGKLTEQDRAGLGLRIERPLLTRSRFYDRNLDDDIHDLAREVDGLLTERSAGRDAKLNFVDVRDAADAYRIAGSYLVEDGTVKVRFRVWRGKQTVGERIEVEGKVGELADLARRILAAAAPRLR